MNEVIIEEVEQEIRPEQIEMKDRGEARSETMTPLEACTMMLKMYTPRYNQLVDKLTVFQAREMLKALPVFPLEAEKYNPKNEIARKAFSIGLQLVEARFTLTLEALSNNLKSVPKVEETVVENTEENVSNG